MERYGGPLTQQVLHTSDSKYAKAYQAGFNDLRFPPTIEREYLQANAPMMRRHLAILGLAGIIVIGLWLLLDLGTTRYFQLPAAWLTLGVWTIPLLATLVLSYRSRQRKRPVNRWRLFVMDVLLGLGLVFLQIEMEHKNLPGAFYPYIALVIMLSAVFGSGMITWRAGLAGVTIAVMYGAAHSLLLPHSHFTSYGIFFLCVTTAVGTYASWRLEHTDREHFLFLKLLGDMAEHDSLTGLLNHAAFMSHGRRAWRYAAREKKPVGLLMVDIDHFKSYNDRYGHPAGDVCIYRIAAVLADAARRGLDMVARLGGEEYALFWYDISAEEVAAKAEAIRMAVRQLEIRHDRSEPSHVTVSIGMYSEIPDETDDFKVALSHADQALYKAKEKGRDRICGYKKSPMHMDHDY